MEKTTLEAATITKVLNESIATLCGLMKTGTPEIKLEAATQLLQFGYSCLQPEEEGKEPWR